ncbi:cysteine hydrolase family protein [Saccharibacillus sp. CPCC 101409]|uniref:cysteine hydrolase family protein n=1 Tax=Saccharibacillus sp. CPCC 101409 TaxID=3058041 RepID=UPI002673811C|nr:cysteine hydrolase family protein [Saccharibacillus sp. CPCC 101409]MDO3413279.1 cysteine hydrolase family protein [Saccharibacillus sp. CPCC 101409]
MKNREGLLVVDVQNAMFAEEPPVYLGEEVAERIARLLHKARAAGTPVVFIRHTEDEGEFAEGTDTWQIHSAVAPLPGETILQKRTSDSFYETGLEDKLKELGVSKLTIAGMQTEYCINATCRRAAELGYNPTLVGDGHSTFDESGETARQIIDRHNVELGDAGVRLKRAEEIEFV